MHRLTSRTYVGQPSETVSLSTQVAQGGQITVSFDGQPIGSNAQFQLSSNPGTQDILQIALVGPLGASCVVGLTVVDNVAGGTDGDFLLCQTHNPAPVNFYTFSVAPQAAVRSFASMKKKAARAGKVRKTRKKRNSR